MEATEHESGRGNSISKVREHHSERQHNGKEVKKTDQHRDRSK